MAAVNWRTRDMQREFYCRQGCAAQPALRLAQGTAGVHAVLLVTRLRLRRLLWCLRCCAGNALATNTSQMHGSGARVTLPHMRSRRP